MVCVPRSWLSNWQKHVRIALQGVISNTVILSQQSQKLNLKKHCDYLEALATRTEGRPQWIVEDVFRPGMLAYMKEQGPEPCKLQLPCGILTF